MAGAGGQRRDLRTTGPVFVGRAPEMAVLRASAEGTGRGGRVLLISGEGGIGKSRLVAEACAVATQRKRLVLASCCHSGAQIPYQPFVAVIRQWLRGRDPATVARLCQGPLRLAAGLLPELAHLFPAGTVDRFAVDRIAVDDLAVALGQVLQCITEDGPLMLAVEDLHWARGDTARLLTVLSDAVEELPIWLVLSYRDDEIGTRHPVAPVLADLERHPRSDQIRLTPLSHDEAGTMARAVAGCTLVDDLVDAVVVRSGGNPLFVEELSRVLSERGRQDGPGEGTVRAAPDWELPLSVREMVISRIRDLASPVADVLLVAAVAGDVVDPQELGHLEGLDRATLEAALSAGLDRRLLVERPDGPLPVYAFRNALTREALLTEVRGPRRRDMHRRIAAALTSAGEGRLDAVAGVLADHHAAAGNAEEALRFALRAARQAVVSCAPIEAIRRFEQALALTPSDDGAGRVALLVEAAEALRSADPVVAGRMVEEGRALARRRDDRLALARLTVVQSLLQWWRGDSDAALLAQQEASELVRGRDDGWELRFVLELGRYHANREERAAADRVVGRAEALVSRGTGSARDRADLLNLRALLARDDQELEDAHARALVAATDAGDQAMLGLTLANAGWAAVWYTSDLRRARVLFTRAEELQRAVRPSHAAVTAAMRAWTDALAGELDAAHTVAVAIAGHAPNVPARIAALLALVEVSWWRGEWAPVARAAAEALDLAERSGESQWRVPALGAMARAHLPEGASAAMPYAERALALCRGFQPHWSFSVDVTRALVAAGPSDELGRWVGSVAAATAAGHGHAHDTAALHLCTGLQAQLEGDLSTSRGLLIRAGEAYESMACPGRAAQAQLALAVTEAAAGRWADAVAAATVAQALARPLKSRPLLAEAASLLRRAGTRPASPAGSVGGAAPALFGRLSTREREVARLLAEACTNAEIARRLFISETTVETHVSHILAKLCLRSRAQVARWALENAPGREDSRWATPKR